MKEKIKEILLQSLKENNIEYEEDIIIENPNKKDNGDYSTNLALRLTKILHKNPLEIAQSITDKINSDLFTKVEIAKPGFINFYMDKKYLLDNINTVLELQENYGRNNIGNHKRYNLEFVSANPTGILHLGNARGGAYGDSLARILRFSGYDVTEEYYVNDAGNQVNNLALSIEARYKTICGIPTDLPENGYHGQEIIEIAKNLYNEHQDTLLNEDIEYYKNLGINSFR